jgi:hypothetical protein
MEAPGTKSESTESATDRPLFRQETVKTVQEADESQASARPFHEVGRNAHPEAQVFGPETVKGVRESDPDLGGEDGPASRPFYEVTRNAHPDAQLPR